MPPQDPYNQPRIPTPGASQPQSPGKPVTSSPYDFIMSSSNGPSAPKMKSGSSKLVFLGIGGVLVVIGIVLAFVLSSGNSATPQLVSIAQQQSEIARVADLNFTELDSSSVKNFAINTNLTMQSTQTNYLKFLSSNGASVDSKSLAGGKSSQTDTTLEAAAANGTLDSATKTELVTELQAYQQTLKTAYDETTSTVAKAEFKRLFDEAALLLEQSNH